MCGVKCIKENILISYRQIYIHTFFLSSTIFFERNERINCNTARACQFWTKHHILTGKREEILSKHAEMNFSIAELNITDCSRNREVYARKSFAFLSKASATPQWKLRRRIKLAPIINTISRFPFTFVATVIFIVHFCCPILCYNYIHLKSSSSPVEAIQQ